MGVFGYYHVDREGRRKAALTDGEVRRMFKSRPERTRLHLEVVKAMSVFGRATGKVMWWVRLVSGVGLLVILVLVPITGGGVSGLVLSQAFIVLVVTLIVVFVIGRPVYASAYTRAQARVLERIGICVHCGYRLTGLPKDEQGLTSCPECTGPWRVERDGLADVRVSSCENCGYDLAGLAPEASGLTVCPECSAMWQVAQ
jgi:ribosomal protein L37AE/L43A